MGLDGLQACGTPGARSWPAGAGRRPLRGGTVHRGRPPSRPARGVPRRDGGASATLAASCCIAAWRLRGAAGYTLRTAAPKSCIPDTRRHSCAGQGCAGRAAGSGTVSRGQGGAAPEVGPGRTRGAGPGTAACGPCARLPAGGGMAVRRRQQQQLQPAFASRRRRRAVSGLLQPPAGPCKPCARGMRTRRERRLAAGRLTALPLPACPLSRSSASRPCPPARAVRTAARP